MNSKKGTFFNHNETAVAELRSQCGTKINRRHKNIIAANHNQTFVSSTDNQSKNSGNNRVLVNHNQTIVSQRPCR